MIDAVPGAEERVQQYLEETVLAEDSALLLRSVLDLKASFARYLNKYYLILRILKTGISLEAMPPWVSENGFSSFQAVC